MPTVNYNGRTISDQTVKDVLQNMSDYFQADVNVTSGDRDYVPEGGSTTSLHLNKRAADFHVDGIDDSVVYLNLRNLGYNSVFESGHGYEFIWHGVHTATGGPHIHMGRYSSATISYVKFKKEGITEDGAGKYPVDISLPIIPNPFGG